MTTDRTFIEYIDGAEDDYGNSILGFVYFTGNAHGVAARMRVPLYKNLPIRSYDGEMAIPYQEGSTLNSYIWLQGEWTDAGPVNLPEINPFEESTGK